MFFTGRLLFGIIVAGMAFWWARSNGYDAFLNVSPGGVPLWLVVLGVLIAGACLIGASLALWRLRVARRTLAEALRTRTSPTRTAEQEITLAAPAPLQPDIASQTDAMVEVPDESRARRRRAARQTVEDTLYFQPFMHGSTDQVAGYMVWLKVFDTHTGRSTFSIDAPIASRFEKAIFELRSIERALGQGKRIIAASAGPDSNMRFHMPISDALLSQPEMVSSLRDLCKAHAGLKRLLVLQVDGQALGKAARCRQSLYDLYDDGFEMALDLTRGPDSKADLTLVSLFTSLVVSARQMQLSLEVDAIGPSCEGGLRWEREAAGEAERREVWQAARSAGLPVLAHGVVCEADIVELVNSDTAFMAGPYFAEPRAIRTDLLEPTPLEKVRLARANMMPRPIDAAREASGQGAAANR